MINPRWTKISSKVYDIRIYTRRHLHNLHNVKKLTALLHTQKQASKHVYVLTPCIESSTVYRSIFT